MNLLGYIVAFILGAMTTVIVITVAVMRKMTNPLIKSQRKTR